MTIARASWSPERLAEGFEALARRAGMVPAGEKRRRDLSSGSPLPERIDALARVFELEAEPCESAYAELSETIARIGPAIVQLPDERSILFVLASSDRSIDLLAPDLSVIRVDARALVDELARPHEARHSGAIDALVARVSRDAGSAERTRAALLREHVRVQIGGLWILRRPAGSGFTAQVLQVGAHRTLLLFLLSHASEYGLLVASWYTFGRAVLDDHLDGGWLSAWILLLLSIVPFRMMSGWASGTTAIRIGALLKRRLLAGALRLAPAEIRREGAGQLLGRVLESGAIESLSLSGGLATVMALVEACVAAFVLASGIGGAIHVLVFAGCLAAYCVAIWRYTRHRSEWTEARLDLTHDLIEKMIGHRTRLAQEPRDAWHRTEDAALERYLHRSRGLDAIDVRLTALLPRAWLIAGIGTLVPHLAKSDLSFAEIAIALGGVLLAYRVLRRFGLGLSDLAGARVAWERIARLFEAPDRARSSIVAAIGASAAPSERFALQARDLVFRHRSGARPTIDGASLEIAAGDRILLRGPSGGGKSTLAAILSGLHQPESGLLLIDGLDRNALGDDNWRTRVVYAAQFHENHVFSGTLGFNLLMGRGWPPSADDLDDAAALIDELGLGRLLREMPSGLEQTVGETGWQLSHGERSRIYIARALLQGANLIIFDESFAALDPETLRTTLECVLRRAPALMVIAHP